MPDRLCRSRDLSTGERGRKREREILCSLLSLRSLCERLREGALSCAERSLLRAARGAGVRDRSLASGIAGGGGGGGGSRANTDVMMAVTWSGVNPPWASFARLMGCWSSVGCRSSVMPCLKAAACVTPLILARADEVGLGALFPSVGGGRPASAALLCPDRLRALSSLASVCEAARAS